jgi:hypothetical protein
VRFLDPSQWQLLVFDDIYARDWRHPGDSIRYYQHSGRKCAEILVPHVVKPDFLSGAYVVDEDAKTLLMTQGFRLPIEVDSDLFFR